MSTLISVIIPTLNEGECIQTSLRHLQAYRSRGVEIVLADGGSADQTTLLAKDFVDQIVEAPRGRANQQNAGARRANGQWLLFLHADTTLPDQFFEAISELSQDRNECWGRFDVRLSGNDWRLRIIECLMNGRSRLTGIATGDQAIFVHRSLFERVGGFASIPIMEDVDLSKRLRSLAAPICLKNRVVTSSRRWETQGVLRTVLLMWRLRFMFFLGVSADRIAAVYYPNTFNSSRDSENEKS